MTIRRNLFILFIPIVSALHSYSQKRTNFWYFGTLAGIDFNSGSPVALSTGALNTTEGCSAASNAAGNLLFYTNGVNVWNKTNAQMPNGFGLKGDVSSTQSALVVPVPGSSTQYYIFTVDYVVGPNGFEYSLVDMTLQAGNGDVTTKNSLIKNNVTEKLAAVYHCNGTDIWVMIHEWNSNKFYAYLVTSSGINPPVVSAVGTQHNGNSVNNSIGQMKFSPDGSRLAAAIGYKDTVDVFNFDHKTGIVSNPLSLSLGNHVYGVEFSPDASKLYVSFYQLGNAGWLAQYDLTASNVPATQTVLGTSFDPNSFYGIQLAPDNKIYAVKEVTSWLGVVNSPNLVGATCNYVDMGFNVDPTSIGIYAMLGLPGFVASYFNAGFPNPPSCSTVIASFQSSDTVICKNTCINFTDLSTGSPTNWQWSFPGATPLSSTVQNPTNVCFPAAGNYTVTLIASDGTSSDTITHTITVDPGSAANAGADVTITTGTSTTLTASGGGTYSWNTGSTANPLSISPTATTTYSVTVTNMNGCSSLDSVTVFVQEPIPAVVCNGPYVGDAFSPNGDELNDILYVHGTGFKNLYFAIYDRWGEKVFETTDIFTGWNGAYKGNVLAPGVFVYYLKAICMGTEKEISQKGNITLFR